MNSHKNLYIFGGLLLLVGIYQVYKGDMMEFSLYTLAGLTFILNALTSAPRLSAYKRLLVILSWIFIIATGILFLYLLRFKFF